MYNRVMQLHIINTMCTIHISTSGDNFQVCKKIDLSQLIYTSGHVSLYFFLF